MPNWFILHEPHKKLKSKYACCTAPNMDGPHHIKVAFMFRDVKPMHPDCVKSNPVTKHELN